MRRKIGFALFALFVLAFTVITMRKIAHDRDAAIDEAMGALPAGAAAGDPAGNPARVPRGDAAG